MDKTRLWIIGSVLAMVIIAGLGWVVGIQPQLDQATAASAETSQVDGGNTIKAAVPARLRKDSEDLPKLKKELAELGAAVPATADWPSFADELNTFATANGVTIIATTQTDGQPYILPDSPKPSAPAAGQPAGAATPTPVPTPTPTPTATPVPVHIPGAPPLTKPTITADNFTLIPVSVTVRGTEDQVLGFVNAAQNGTRLFLVNGITIDTAASGVGYDAKLSGYIYVLTSSADKKASK